MKEKCYIKSNRKTPTENCMVSLRRATHSQLKELGCETGKSITNLTEELLRFALDRVEIVYPNTTTYQASGQ